MAKKTPPDFDEELYLKLNPDVALAVSNGEINSGSDHWLNHGNEEERIGRRPGVHLEDSTSRRPIRETPFDPASYLKLHRDLSDAFGEDLEAATKHWQQSGWIEGRIGSTIELKARNFNPRKMIKRKFGINFFAPFSVQSGLGSASRGYLKAIRAARIPVHIVNIDYSQPSPRISGQDYQSKLPYRINLLQVNADILEKVVSLFAPGHFDDAYNIGIWAWEMNVLRPDWFGAFRFIDEIWSPSEYNAQSIDVISPVPVKVVNHVILKHQRLDYTREYFCLPTGFLFLCAFDVGSSMERKNPYGVLEAFLRRFKDNGNVHLLFKFHSAHHDSKAVRKFTQLVAPHSNIHIRTKLYSSEEMNGLVEVVDCVVSAHRSEGFGLNLAEAMLKGKPVIATGYSGNLDFMSEENALLVPYKISRVETQSGPYLPGYLWADPDIEAFSDRMMQVVANPNAAADVGRIASISIEAKLSPEFVGDVISSRLKELGLTYDVLPLFMLEDRRSTSKLSEIDTSKTDIHEIRRMPGPVISVITPVYNVDANYLRECIESVRAQSYSNWELCICDDASTSPETTELLNEYKGIDPRIRIYRMAHNGGIAAASNTAVQFATGEWLLMLDNDDTLTRTALSEIAEAIRNSPDIQVIYSDEDKIDPAGRFCDTYYKPNWSPEHLESVMYTLHPLTIRTALFLELGGFRREFSGAQDWDLMLRASRATEAIHHIPKILYHWRIIPGSAAASVDAKPQALEVGHLALIDHVKCKYGPHNAKVIPVEPVGHYRVKRRVSDDTKVTLVITTDSRSITLAKKKPFVMIENFVNSIVRNTAYRNYEILVVDNTSSDAKVRNNLVKLGVRLSSFQIPSSGFNYAQKANFALSQVVTDQLVMLNDDMEVINSEWLEALIEFSQDKAIGCVGPKLLHADETIQSVGTVLGIGGGAAHVYHGFPGNFIGYNGYTHVIRNYSAVTGACLATRKSLLYEIGGWDERFAIDYNDTDLCLRMIQNGYRVVFTPHSKLYHFESKTAVRLSQDPDEVKLFQKRWKSFLDNDPYYNPNLSRHKHDFSLLE